MRIQSIRNTQPRYNKTQNKVEQNTNYMTQTASQGFGIRFPWTNSEKRVAEVVKPKAIDYSQQIIDRLFALAGDEITKGVESETHTAVPYLNALRKNINEETAPFADSLIRAIKNPWEVKDNFGTKIRQFNELVTTYKQIPNARKTMQETAEAFAQMPQDSKHFAILRMHDLFNDEYRGTDIQNRFIEKIVAAKKSDGSPRFLGESFLTNGIFHNYSTPAQEEAFNLILDQKSVVKKDVADYKVLTSMVMDLPVEEYAAKSKHATHQIEVDKYLVNSDDDFSGILKHIDFDKLPVLKQLLPRVKGEHSGVVASILKDYTPMHEKILAKGLQLVDRGEMSLYELSKVIDAAGGDVPFRA